MCTGHEGIEAAHWQATRLGANVCVTASLSSDFLTHQCHEMNLFRSWVLNDADEIAAELVYQT